MTSSVRILGLSDEMANLQKWLTRNVITSSVRLATFSTSFHMSSAQSSVELVQTLSASKWPPEQCGI